MVLVVLCLLLPEQGIVRAGSRNKKRKGIVKDGHGNKKNGIFSAASSFDKF